ncbi:MAG: glycosyltransferase family 39 protein [Planctomycetaceae bacterium]
MSTVLAPLSETPTSRGGSRLAHLAVRLQHACCARQSAWLLAMTGLAVALGVGLRLSQYALDRSLFLDEVFVATNVVQRPLGQLVQTLEHDQRAPAGFLAAVKLTTHFWRTSDLVLRIVPLLSGLAAMLLFPVVARRLTEDRVAAFATLLFALSPTMVFMSSDLKQYSTDAAATLLLLAIVPFHAAERRQMGRWLLLALAGGGCLWFSFPAVFVLAATGTTLAAVVLRGRERRSLMGVVFCGCVWGLAALGLYLVQLRYFASEPSWKRLWDGSFLPIIPTSAADLLWLPRKLVHLATVPAGLGFGGVAASALLLGVNRQWRSNRLATALLLGPIVVALLASGARVYPFGGRVITFLAPIVLLLVAQGVAHLACVPSRTARLAACLLAVFVLFDPAEAAARHVLLSRAYSNTTFFDYKLEESKLAMRFIRDRWRPGDVVYLYSDARTHFWYYADQFGFRREDSIRGIQSALMNPRWDEVEADLAKLSGRPRVWVFLTHVWQHNGVDDRKLYLYFLDRLGRRLEAYEAPEGCDASAYLYDMSQTDSQSVSRELPARRRREVPTRADIDCGDSRRETPDGPRLGATFADGDRPDVGAGNLFYVW